MVKIFPRVGGRLHAQLNHSTAWVIRSSSWQCCNAPSCVASSMTWGAWPLTSASCHRGAQRHQRSPSLSPGNPYWGIGVERSLPQARENSRNESVTMMQAVKSGHGINGAGRQFASKDIAISRDGIDGTDHYDSPYICKSTLCIMHQFETPHIPHIKGHRWIATSTGLKHRGRWCPQCRKKTKKHPVKETRRNL